MVIMLYNVVKTITGAQPVEERILPAPAAAH
jgi:hypothetical protein